MSEHQPSAANPFVTQSKLTFELPLGVTQPQRDALDAAEAASEHQPSAANPFVTQSKLPTGEAPPAWPSGHGVSDIQKAALDAAEAVSEHQPSAANPFVTQSKLTFELPLGVTQPQRDALDAAEAVAQPEHKPSSANPFVTSQQLPIGVTQAQRQALDSANQPGAGNPVATIADLGTMGITTRVVAGGTIDLSQVSPTLSLGGLKLINNRPEYGLATLSFPTYKMERKNNYLIHALPITAGLLQDPKDLAVIQLVEFAKDGFTLQMARLDAKGFVLGPCMIEVSEIFDLTEPPLPTLEQAIKDYYSLIQQARYAEAWPMLSQRFKDASGMAGLQWEKAEYDIAGLDLSNKNYWAELVVYLRRGSTALDAAAVKNYGHRIAHLSGKGGLPDQMAWQGGFGQDGNRPTAVVWHVASGDVLENNPGYYRCEIHNGEPPNWPAPGQPIAVTGDFQLPRKGKELRIAVDLNLVTQSLDFAGFKTRWETSGPAIVLGLEPVRADGISATYILDLYYRNAIPAQAHKRIRYDFIRDPGVGHARFGYWLFLKEQIL